MSSSTPIASNSVPDDTRAAVPGGRPGSGRFALTSLGLLRGASGDPAGDVCRVPTAAADQHGGEGVLEGQPAEVEAGCILGDAAVLAGPAVVAEDGKVDPVEDLAEAGRPDDVGDVEHGAVGQDRQAVADVVDP